MTEFLFIGMTLLFFLLSARLAGPTPFPTLFIALLAVSETVFALAHRGMITYDMLAVIGRGGLTQNFTPTLFIYATTAALSLLAPAGQFFLYRKARIDATKREKRAGKKNFVAALYAVAALELVYFLLFLSASDWDLLWYNTAYLLPIMDADSAGLLGSEMVETVMRMMLFAAILSAAGLYAALALKKPFFAALFTLFELFYFLILFSLHSRSAALIPLLIAVLHYTLRCRRKKTAALLLVLVSFFSLSCALQGRGYTEQGISSIPITISRFFDQDPLETIGDIAVNFSEGVFSTAESLQITDSFSSQYKILAFSPLPSFIDGYASIRESQEHRLHLYAPMSGIAEAIHFGWPFVCLLIALGVIAVRLHSRLAKDKPVLFLFCNFLIMFSFYHLLAYPVRNGLRFLWLAVFISLLALVKLKTGAFLGRRAR